MSDMHVVIAMNGVTGRMGRSQHLERSIMAIRRQGGVVLPNGDRIIPEPILVGRNEQRLSELAGQFDLTRWSTDVGAVLRDPDVDVYFDSQLTHLRSKLVREAIDAGKAIYCEKPLAETSETAYDLVSLAKSAGVKNGVVTDKLFLPGLIKLRKLIDEEFFGRILSVRIDFGYWVFEGFDREPQRPSWNYKADEGGSIILDMFPHWYYVIEGLFGEIESVSTLGTTHVPLRFDKGEEYDATADDAAYATFVLAGGVVVQVNSSWTTRVHRDDLVTFQVDGVEGSAVAGLRDCVVQSRADTPTLFWNPDIPNETDFRAGWTPVEDRAECDNGFKVQWEKYLRHIVCDDPFPWDFHSAARGADLVDAATTSWRERRWVDMSEVRS